MDQIEIKLNRDHWHGGKFFPAGTAFAVSERRRDWFARRGMLADTLPAKKKPAKKKAKPSEREI